MVYADAQLDNNIQVLGVCVLTFLKDVQETTSMSLEIILGVDLLVLPHQTLKLILEMMVNTVFVNKDTYIMDYLVYPHLELQQFVKDNLYMNLEVIFSVDQLVLLTKE